MSEVASRVLADRYRLESLLGRGGMGEVWRALDSRLGRHVAVKMLLAAEADPLVVARFRREAEVAATLNHPGIATLHDIDEHDEGGRRLMFLVLELLEGRDLTAVLADHRGGLPVEVVVDWAGQVLDALAAAHDRGVVHRDIKPANLFVTDSGRIKICDFGIARLADATQLSATGSIAGTPLYMAPEQIQSMPVDHRTDLYAFGCVLYEMLTGAVWVDHAGGVAAILYQHIDRTPPPLRGRRPDIPAHLDALVLDLLAKRPDDRVVDAVEAARRLQPPSTVTQPAGMERPAPAIPATQPALPPTVLAPPRPGPAPQHPQAPPAVRAAQREGVGRRWVLLGGLGLAGAAAVGVPATILLSSNGHPGATPKGRPAPASATPRPLAVTVTPASTLDDPNALGNVAFSPAGTLATTTTGNAAKLWNPTTGKAIATLTAPNGPDLMVSSMAFSPDAKLLAAGSVDKTVRLWDLATRKPVAMLHHPATVQSVAFSPDGKVLATGTQVNDGAVRLWDVTTGRQIAKLMGSQSTINTLAFSPDGKTLAIGLVNYSIQLWNLTSRSQIATLDQTKDVAIFSPDGKTLITGYTDDGMMQTFDAATRRPLALLVGLQGSVNAMAFRPAGRILAAVGDSASAGLWDVATGTNIATLTGLSGTVDSVAFSPDGTTLATSSNGDYEPGYRHVRLWKVQ